MKIKQKHIFSALNSEQKFEVYASGCKNDGIFLLIWDQSVEEKKSIHTLTCNSKPKNPNRWAARLNS